MDASSNLSGMSMSMSMDTASYAHSPHPKTPHRYPNTRTTKETWDLEEARLNLRTASSLLSHRCLKIAACWAAEHLNSLASSAPVGDSSTNGIAQSSKSGLSMGNDLELYAKSIFDIGEYHRAAAVLSINPHEGSCIDAARAGKRKVSTRAGDLTIFPPRESLTSYGIYLRAYALYMAGERRKEEEVLELR